MNTLNSRLQLAALNRKKSRNLLEKGFTLVELMIVIVIVGILSAVALPNFLSQTAKAKATECTTKGGSMMSQVGPEALISPTDAKTMLDDLVARENTGNEASELCTFAAGAKPADNAAQIYTLTAIGKANSPIDGDYFAAFCVNATSGKRDISTSTTTAQTAGDVTC
jgi:type IV pilus assembly protein PilA